MRLTNNNAYETGNKVGDGRNMGTRHRYALVFATVILGCAQQPEARLDASVLETSIADGRLDVQTPVDATSVDTSASDSAADVVPATEIRILSFTADREQLSFGSGSVRFSVVATHSMGADRIIGGQLQDVSGRTYGVLTAASLGSFTFDLSFSQILSTAAIASQVSSERPWREFRVRLFDQSGAEGLSSVIRISFTCGPATTWVCDNACVDTRGSSEHCGACGTRVMQSGTCVDGVPTCPQNWQVCSGSANCVPLTTNIDCGACGRAVSSPNGRCVNGVPGCSDGYALCGGNDCINLGTSRSHCGGCGRVVPSDASCQAACAVCNNPDSRIIGQGCRSISNFSYGMAAVYLTGSNEFISDSCSGSGPKAAFFFTPGSTANYSFDAYQNGLNPTIYVREDGTCGGGELGCGRSGTLRLSLTRGTRYVVVVSADRNNYSGVCQLRIQ